jgi:alpha-mannosidase
MLPLKAVQSYRKICDGLASELSFIHVDNPEISVGSVKRSETGDGIVVRVYNNTGKTIDSALYTWRPVAAADEVDSLEQFKCTLKHSKNMVRICLAAKRFMSVKISFA